MGNQRGLGIHLIFISIFLVATTYTCLGVRNISIVCSQQERHALLKFKNSVKDNLGMLSSWVGNDCCQWEGIHCDVVTGKIESLRLRGDHFVDAGYHLVGNDVNSSLKELRHLKYLDLSANDFRGSCIPKFIGSFKQLIYLNLSHAGFQGIIPHHIGNLSNLKVLDLSSNRELMADDMAWTFGLLSLEYLDLSLLDLSGAQNWDMVLSMIPSLKVLSLSECGLYNTVIGPFHNSSGILPNIKHLDISFLFLEGLLPRFFQNMTSLAFLDLSGFDISLAWNFANFLNMIPSLSELHLSSCGIDKTFFSPSYLNLSVISNIQHLDLSRNSIGGIFPLVVTNMSSLRVLDVSGNNLNSSIPTMPNLLELDISSNEFTQIEHVGIWRRCHMKQLSVSDNNFDREMIDIPMNTTKCSQYALEGLYLGWNLIGKIPEPLEKLANLIVLYLSNSGLTGPIPKSIRRLRFLEVLDLSYNQLIGSIPTFFGKLSILDLSFNQLNGSIPESFGNLATLTDLNLGSNRLTGPIPASLGKLVSLETMLVGSNLLNGVVPVSVGQLVRLHSLDISNNSIDGAILEAHLANLSMLKDLDASLNTKLTFNVSREWIPSFQLEILRLSSCNITNGFPQWLRNQRKLETLDLSNSTISGTLPTWLWKMPTIPYLDLSHNKLSGPLTNLPNGGKYDGFHDRFIHKLFLENNYFNESIPWSLCRWTDLGHLDLSRNRLTGKIPKCLNKMKKLLTMIFSSNRLSGIIPGSIALNFSSLVWLQLNDNSFIGELPQEFVNLRDLRVLDLGDNKFSGNIPEWIGENLTSLVVLRLHNNNFTGRVPLSLCKTSKLQILDVAYNFLMGTIPGCLGELNAMIKSIHVSLGNATLESDQNVIQVLKGVDLEYKKTWDIVFNMDLSSNNLVGEIPVKLTSLSMLVGLNLSNNHLSGGIPDNIGNMTELFSLDLSGNKLIGMIPPSLAALTFLSHLNLSYNNLSGQIPTGNQLQTLTDSSIYVGNKYLCGAPLPKNCSIQEDPTRRTNKKYKAVYKPTKIWLFYADIVSGVATGFWGIIGVLLFKKQWRQKLFKFAEETMDKIHVAVLVRVANLKRGQRNRIDPF